MKNIQVDYVQVGKVKVPKFKTTYAGTNPPTPVKREWEKGIALILSDTFCVDDVLSAEEKRKVRKQAIINLIHSIEQSAYERGRQSILDEWKEEKKKKDYLQLDQLEDLFPFLKKGDKIGIDDGIRKVYLKVLEVENEHTKKS